MSADVRRCQRLLLGLLAEGPRASLVDVSGIDAATWSLLADMARVQRLGPVLHWRLAHGTRVEGVPETVLATLRDSFRSLTLRSLSLQRDMLWLHARLERMAVPHCFLKGAFLAFHAYPQPGLRPMRDIDVLVPSEHALPVFSALLESGMTRVAHHAESAPQDWLERYRHLPPLQFPGGRVLELHVGLFDAADQELRSGLSHGLWQRVITAPVAGRPLCFLGPADLLLHLIVHAVYQHQFDNGPLVFSDVAWLLRRWPVDWSVFWAEVERGGYARGVSLVLRMVEKQHGDLGIVWPDPPAAIPETPAALIDAATLLTVGDFDARRDVHFRHELASRGTLRGKLSVIGNKLFPPAEDISAIAYQIAVPLPGRFAGYLGKWRWLLFRRLPRFVSSLGQRHLTEQVDQVRVLRTWLGRPTE